MPTTATVKRIKQTPVTLPPSIKKLVKRDAKAENISASAIVRRIVVKHYEQEVIASSNGQ